MGKKGWMALPAIVLAFLMAAGCGQIQVRVTDHAGGQEEILLWLNPYTDVARSAWYYDAVKFVTQAELMNGTTTTRFAPEQATDRAMIVTILWRQAGSPSVGGEASFSDVDLSAWYDSAVRWAAANKIVTGYGDGTFGPEDTITREQMAAILYRYAQYKGNPTDGEYSLDGYTDVHQISAYALPAFQWVCGCGIMEGLTTDTLDPAESATRAQVAAILMRFCDMYGL